MQDSRDSEKSDSCSEERGNDAADHEEDLTNSHKTNSMLQTLLKKVDQQDKRITELTRNYAASTPTRKSATSRQKEVPLQVRVSNASSCRYLASYFIIAPFREKRAAFMQC